LEFDVYESCRLNSVTLYASGTYERSFELINEFGMVLASTTDLVQDGMHVLQLDWDIEPGVNYGLRCTTDDPQLWREGTSSTLSYPYAVGDLLSITNSTAGPSLDYYYFFYEWVAEPLPVECASERVDVTVTVGEVDGTGALNASEVRVFPNPASAGTSLTLRGVEMGSAWTLTDSQGRTVQTGTWDGALTVGWPSGTYLLQVTHAQGQVVSLPLVVR
jgi:hypothetical protein